MLKSKFTLVTHEAARSLQRFGDTMKHIAVEDFDPNTDIESNVWAVYDGRFKTYKNRGPALNRMIYANSAKLFELVNGTWVERVYKKREDLGSHPCDICGDSPLAAYQPPNRPPVYAHGYWEWERNSSGKIASPPKLIHLCATCYGIRG
jgi:hypothetical protein